MSIAQNESSSINTLQAHAVEMYRLGFNVLPMRLDNKSPNLKSWHEYSKRRQTEQEVLSFDWLGNIGIVCGISNIRVIDLDNCSNGEVLFKLLELLGLDFEYKWVVWTPGGGGGYHIYIQCPDPLSLTSAGVLVGDPLDGNEFKQIELRWHDCVCMFPPSIHPDIAESAQDYERRYDWHLARPDSPMAVVPLAIVEKAFLALATIRKITPKPLPELPPAKSTKYDYWSEKALNQELATLRAATAGGRNIQLNKSAFALGQIIGAGLLDQEDVTRELTRVALTIDLEEKETADTIASGLDAGILKPRMPKQVYRENEPPFRLKPVRDTDEEKIASFTADDQGHADTVFYLYRPYIAYTEAYGWMIWNGTHFTPSVQRINSLIVSVLRRRHQAAVHLERTELAKVSKAMAGTVSACRSLLENLAVVDVSEFDAEPDLINTASGIVNLRTKKLLPHDPVYKFTWCSPVRYNPATLATCGELWLAFMNATVDSPEMVDYLQEALGYSITGHISEEALFYIFGPPRAGKGTLSETLLAIFPRPIASEVDFNTFTAKREGDNQNFDLAPMKSSRLVFASESNKYQSLNPAKIKALTGGNLVSCAFKYGQHFSYRPQYAIWLSSNHEVNADSDDEAVWNRVKVVSFPYSRLGQEDKTLKWRMQEPENLEAVLAWLVEGAYLWYQHAGRGLNTPEAVKELTQAQRNLQDSVGVWLKECCALEPTEWTENSKIMASYEKWCEMNGHEAKKAKGLAQSLAAHGLETGVNKRVTDENLKQKMVRGVRGLVIL